MYLKSITLKGFKSFPDRTRLEFGPGVSVVVGPNGSGKSNITDAVLWALGEQSPLAVRGQSMQDVIFAGAPGRQAAGAAEVELVLDDSEGALGLGMPEVSIVRRLDRSGEGEYRLAGARCRLVDVTEALSDTGLGKEMHSVISQGRVESLVTSKPRDRRLLIEEAAGLGKHRKRRRRAQLKLARTQDNLDRALDVEREARSRLRPLKRQAEAAELHARLERQALEARWELVRDDARVERRALDAAQAEAALARQRRARVEQQVRDVAERREAAEEALAARSAQREELSRRVFRAQAAAERVSYRADSVRAAHRTIEARLRRHRERLSALEASPPAEEPGAEERIAELEAALAALESDRQAELARELAELEAQLAAADDALAERSALVEQRHQARQQTEADLERGRGVVREAERAVEAARREAARMGGELAAVNQFLRSGGAALGGASTLADQLEVDPGYELALAAALDGRLRASLAADRAGAVTLLDRAGADGGRVLVPPPHTTAVPHTDAPVVGAQRLLDHVRGPVDALAVARMLLQDAWLVESLDAMPDSFAGLALTADGRVWSGSTRELRQAPRAGEERVLAQRNRRQELVRATEAAAQAEHAAAATLARRTDDAARAETEHDRAVAAHREAVRERDESSEEQRRLRAAIERRRAAPDEGPAAARALQLEAQVSAERSKLERAERERAERLAQIERLCQAIGHDELLGPAVARVIGALDAVAGAISDKRAEFESALVADRQAGEHLAAELRACAQQEAALHAELHRESEALTAVEVRVQRISDRAADIDEHLRGLAARLDLGAEPATEELTADAREALTARLERLARRREQLGPVNPLARLQYTEAVEHVEELERQRADLEKALRELEKLIADTDRQIRETFEHTFEAAARNFEEVSAQLFPGGRGRLRLVAERDGPARVLGGASAPAPDDAGEDALETAAEADLVPEEELRGVEIEITPAGKDMKRLSLLSGGEKSMTALAFLFAVFLARPCPFYILDEVEAALDDLNIDRFLHLLRSYSRHAQFIVVTHQRRTMEAADSLYGVSMGGDGISKVISRRLGPAEQAA